MRVLPIVTPVNDELGRQILKDVSRSFYLTLRLLPRGMRSAASLGYLLARISDTIADTEGVSMEERLSLLGGYAASVADGAPLPPWPGKMLGTATPGEVRMLERAPEVLEWLTRTDSAQAALIREVVAVIISGQAMDLTRFVIRPDGETASIGSSEELDDYTWRVAGCVGEFWTKLGYLSLGDRYSSAEQEDLLRMGIRYGKGLQLVNILRDLPKDLENGRCYLPVSDSLDKEALMREYASWHRRAVEGIGQGIRYASCLRSRRLRAATVLPALIAEETLNELKEVSWDRLRQGVKVPRRRIYRLMLKALMF